MGGGTSVPLTSVALDKCPPKHLSRGTLFRGSFVPPPNDVLGVPQSGANDVNGVPQSGANDALRVPQSGANDALHVPQSGANDVVGVP